MRESQIRRPPRIFLGGSPVLSAIGVPIVFPPTARLFQQRQVPGGTLEGERGVIGEPLKPMLIFCKPGVLVQRARSAQFIPAVLQGPGQGVYRDFRHRYVSNHGKFPNSFRGDYSRWKVGRQDSASCYLVSRVLLST